MSYHSIFAEYKRIEEEELEEEKESQGGSA
jgi:hypothetical protein